MDEEERGAVREARAAWLGVSRDVRCCFGNYDKALIMECSKYGDFDKLREHKDEVWDRLGQEASEFFLPGQGQAILLRELGDVKVMEPLKKKK